MSSNKKVDKKKVEDKKVKTVTYSGLTYCNLRGFSKAVKHVALRKYKGEGRKSEGEWKEIFKKDGLS